MTTPSTPLRICPVGSARPVAFAARELRRYLLRMAGRPLEIVIEPQPSYQPAAAPALWLGVAADLASALPAGLPAVPDSALDDAYAIAIANGQGFIVGVNPRSVLLATYRALTEAGCRWVRPGADGELIPRLDPARLTVRVSEQASYRHRGLCIEGAVSYENIAAILDWLPKLGLNAYFFQFRESFTFFERWYSHRENPTLAPEPFTVQRAREFLHLLEAEIGERGLLYHAVGHGWTCEPFGIPGLSWERKDYHLPPEVTQLLAEVNGQRAIWQGIPLNTNLCYSNPAVRQTMVQSIADHLQLHRNVDILHFWLADGSNNQCECANCRQALPADWYVQTLNELDELLTQRNLPTKIVFLVYVDLLWPPQVQRLRNPGRFILMFAPITRSYSQEFVTDGAAPAPALPPYQRNQLRFPANVAENVAFLQAWQAQFAGDSFDFDYHLMWDHFRDPGYYAVARTLGRDIQHLREIGLNGYISCQLQRIFFPTALPQVVLGRTLWNDKLTFEAIAADYFASAFGPEGGLVCAYLADLSARFDPPTLREERPLLSAEAAARYAALPGAIQAFRPVIARNLALAEPCQAHSWKLLEYHALYCTLLAQVLAAKAAGDQAAASARWEELLACLRANEPAIQSVFDLYLFVGTMRRILA